MAAPYEPLIAVDGSKYYPPPYSAPHLSPSFRWSLFPLGFLALCSVLSTLATIVFILSRFITWRNPSIMSIRHNQYIVLVLNLLIADLQQAGSYLVSWYWIHQDRILAPSAACFAQAWLLHSGDVGSGFFVLAIALHTFYTAVYGRRVGYKTFCVIIGTIWTFAYAPTVLGVPIKGKKYFVLAGAWCWVSSAFEEYRLWCHYVWIFSIQFGTVLIYIATFFILRKKTRRFCINGHLPANNPSANTLKAINRVTMLMTLYPCVYVLLTLPLSAGRMWSYAHHGQATSHVYSIVAGCLLTSCGWVDSAMYTLTRKRLIQHSLRNSAGRRTSSGGGPDLDEPPLTATKGITHTRTVTVETDGASELELTHPGANRTMAFYNIASVQTPSRGGEVNTMPPPTSQPFQKLALGAKKVSTAAGPDRKGHPQPERSPYVPTVMPLDIEHDQLDWSLLSDEDGKI